MFIYFDQQHLNDRQRRIRLPRFFLRVSFPSARHAAVASEAECPVFSHDVQIYEENLVAIKSHAGVAAQFSCVVSPGELKLADAPMVESGVFLAQSSGGGLRNRIRAGDDSAASHSDRRI